MTKANLFLGVTILVCILVIGLLVFVNSYKNKNEELSLKVKKTEAENQELKNNYYKLETRLKLYENAIKDSSIRKSIEKNSDSVRIAIDFFK